MPIDHSDNPKERLLSLVAQGNKQAFGYLYEQYLDEIYRYVFYRVGDPLEAEDITENVFLKTWERLPKLYSQGDQIDNFRAWIYRIAQNLIVDFYRSRKPIQPKDGFVPIDDNSPEEITDRKISSRRLAKAIMELEPNFQQIIILRFINQLSHKEAALIMNLSHGHTRVLQYRALKKLQTNLSSKEDRDV
jgi:RNA polymerase sigma-70 factor (ECF subfamily)